MDEYISSPLVPVGRQQSTPFHHLFDHDISPELHDLQQQLLPSGCFQVHFETPGQSDHCGLQQSPFQHSPDPLVFSSLGPHTPSLEGFNESQQQQQRRQHLPFDYNTASLETMFPPVPTNTPMSRRERLVEDIADGLGEQDKAVVDDLVKFVMKETKKSLEQQQQQQEDTSEQPKYGEKTTGFNVRTLADYNNRIKECTGFVKKIQINNGFDKLGIDYVYHRHCTSLRHFSRYDPESKKTTLWFMRQDAANSMVECLPEEMLHSEIESFYHQLIDGKLQGLSRNKKPNTAKKDFRKLVNERFHIKNLTVFIDGFWSLPVIQNLREEWERKQPQEKKQNKKKQRKKHPPASPAAASMQQIFQAGAFSSGAFAAGSNSYFGSPGPSTAGI